MSPVRVFIASLLALSACSPLIRFGEIEPPEGTKTLIVMEVKPKPAPGLSPEELAAAVSDGGIAVLATTPQPRVATGDAQNEMASNVQGSSVPAKEALVDEGMLATDARRIESIYKARGYFRAKNIGHHIVVLGDDRAGVTFEVLEGIETTISEINFLDACEFKTEDPDVEKGKRLRRVCRETRELMPMIVGDIWTEAAYANGLDILSRAFRAAGFLHARVSGDNWVSRDKNLAAIAYTIDSGPLVRVMGEVVVEGNVHVDLDRIRDRIDIKEGDILDDELLRQTERNIQDLGPFFSVQAAVIREVVSEAPPGALIETPKVPGPLPEALVPTSPAPSDAPDSPGPTSPAAPLADEPVPDGVPEKPVPEVVTEKPLGEMTPTDALRPSVLRPDKMQVKVQVAEAPLWELTVGPSIVTDFKRLEFGLPLSFTHRNVFEEVIAMQTSARPALVFPDCFTGTSACFTNPKFGLDAKLGIQVPSFFEEYLRLSFDANYKRDVTQETAVESIGGSLGLSRRIVRGVTARIGYNIAFYNYFATNTLIGLNPTLDDGKVNPDYRQLQTDIDEIDLRFREQDFLAWFDVALVVDLRDSPLDAKNGLFLSLSANFAGPYAGSDVPYTRLLGDVRGYWTPRFLRWLTLGARIMVGHNSYDEALGTPQPARFKSGGATSHRGFSTDRLGDFLCGGREVDGPYLNNPECGNNSTDRTYVGGNYIIESNFELRFHLRDGIGLVVFADVGRVWSTGGYQLEDLFVAIGPGFRYDLPVGPIRFDIGFRLGKRRATEFHFSLGQAF